MIIKIPFSAGSLGKNKECSLAPDAILSELNSCYTKEELRQVKPEVKELRVDSSNIEKSFSLIEQYIAGISNKFIALGGDHSISYPILKGFSTRHRNFCLLVFDAHPDVMQSFQPPTHEDWLRVLVEQEIVKPNGVVMVGIRNPHIAEIEFIKRNGLRIFTMKHCFELGVKQLTSVIMENCKPFNAIYMSIDIDAIDPAFAPGTGYIEPGGFTSREFLHMIQRISLLKNLQGVDIVEVNPSRDINKLTVRLAARLLSELL